MANLYKYNNFPVQAFSGAVDWPGGVIKVALLADTYIPDQNAHVYWSDVSTHEVTGTNYTAGGATIANASVTINTSNNSVVLDGDAVSWPESTITARHVIIYQDTGTATTSVLCGFADLGENKSSSNGDFNLNWSASGIFEIIIQSPA